MAKIVEETNFERKRVAVYGKKTSKKPKYCIGKELSKNEKGG